ncbi:hypothetical protein B0H14DRAFT_3854431 [Mycena olivaceomarginata]|nr:hypothetical protein B0H14DRAFT_3854431 [Mycena olivaceomarginata]
MSTTFGDTVNSPTWIISSPFKPIPIKTQKLLNAKHKWSSRGISDLLPSHPTAAAVSCARIGGYNCTHITHLRPFLSRRCLTSLPIPLPSRSDTDADPLSLSPSHTHYLKPHANAPRNSTSSIPDLSHTQLESPPRPHLGGAADERRRKSRPPPHARCRHRPRLVRAWAHPIPSLSLSRSPIRLKPLPSTLTLQYPPPRTYRPLHAALLILRAHSHAPPFSTLLLHTPSSHADSLPPVNPRTMIPRSCPPAADPWSELASRCLGLYCACLAGPYTMTLHAAAPLTSPFSTVIPPPAPTPTPTRSSLFSLFPSPQAPGTTTTIIVVSSSDAAQRSAAHSRLRSPVFQACCIATF